MKVTAIKSWYDTSSDYWTDVFTSFEEAVQYVYDDLYERYYDVDASEEENEEGVWYEINTYYAFEEIDIDEDDDNWEIHW